jgi:hypothetical protein
MSTLETSQGTSVENYDLADHFLACAKLGRYLTVASGTRFFITDDFQDRSVIHSAAAIAAIYSKDNLVAEAALMPLSGNVLNLKGDEREKYERLFHLIEEQTLSEDVRYTAKSLIEARFRESKIREIEAQLGGKISPARERYRQFLGIVKQLMDQQITAKPFIEEFKEFTQDVAGKLDFGIYSFCLDSLFRSLQIPATVKKLLVMEIIIFPTLIRRELLSNVLSYPGQTRDLVEFVNLMMDRQLDPEALIEIDLLKDLKLRRFSMEAISALAIESGLAAVH